MFNYDREVYNFYFDFIDELESCQCTKKSYKRLLADKEGDIVLALVQLNIELLNEDDGNVDIYIARKELNEFFKQHNFNYSLNEED